MISGYAGELGRISRGCGGLLLLMGGAGVVPRQRVQLLMSRGGLCRGGCGRVASSVDGLKVRRWPENEKMNLKYDRKRGQKIRVIRSVLNMPSHSH